MSCPFCNMRDFGIKYTPPDIILEEERQDPSSNNIGQRYKPQTVKCEPLRLYRPASATGSAMYRAATTRHQHYAGPPFTVRSSAGGRATTYGGGILILYNERGQPIYYTQPTTSYRSVRYEPYRAPAQPRHNTAQYPGQRFQTSQTYRGHSLASYYQPMY